MKRKTLQRLAQATAVVALSLGLTACRSTVKVDGKSYSMLYDSEIEELISAARFTLQRNSDKSQIVTKSELKNAFANTPDVEIDYFGNCLGNAKISWDFPNRTTIVVFKGELNNPRNRFIAVNIKEKMPAIIDASGTLPKDAAIFKTK